MSTKDKEAGILSVTTLYFIAISGIDLSGGAAHFAAVSPAASVEDPCTRRKSPRSVTKNAYSIISVCQIQLSWHVTNDFSFYATFYKYKINCALHLAEICNRYKKHIWTSRSEKSRRPFL